MRRRAFQISKKNMTTNKIMISQITDILKILNSIIFFFNDTDTTEIYTLSLHDALPIFVRLIRPRRGAARPGAQRRDAPRGGSLHRSEEHTSELQSRRDVVCRPLLE